MPTDRLPYTLFIAPTPDSEYGDTHDRGESTLIEFQTT